jgi:hypothetical protein
MNIVVHRKERKASMQLYFYASFDRKNKGLPYNVEIDLIDACSAKETSQTLDTDSAHESDHSRIDREHPRRVGRIRF